MDNRLAVLETELSNIYQDLMLEKRIWPSLEIILREYIKDRRWFRSKARHILSCAIMDVIPLHFLKSTAYIVILQVYFTSGEPETYTIPLMITPADYANEITSQFPSSIIAHVKTPDVKQDRICFDATVDRDFSLFLLNSIARQTTFQGLVGEISAASTRVFNDNRDLKEASLIPGRVNKEQTNTSITYGNQAILKLFRRIEDGLNPELEISRFLTEKTSFANSAPLLGTIEYRIVPGPVKSMAVLQTYVPNKGDAWQYSLDSLDSYFQSVMTNHKNLVPDIPQRHLLSIHRGPPLLAKETIGDYLSSAQLLGQRTAELHKALSSVTDDPDFAPEPFSIDHQRSLYQSLYDLTSKTFRMLDERQDSVPEDTGREIKRILKSKDAILERFQLISSPNISTLLMRCHGDYHLGQVLYTGDDFIIIDFEGEPARPLSERRSKISPIQDVAGMLRSFDYASQSALNRQELSNTGQGDNLPDLQPWARYWYTWVSIAFLKSYLEHIREAHLIPEDTGQLKVLLDTYLLEKNIYEIGYELNNRPDWLKVPVQGILRLLESG